MADEYEKLRVTFRLQVVQSGTITTSLTQTAHGIDPWLQQFGQILRLVPCDNIVSKPSGVAFEDPRQVNGSTGVVQHANGGYSQPVRGCIELPEGSIGAPEFRQDKTGFTQIAESLAAPLPIGIAADRSEERRVGKECRSRRGP